MGLLLTRKTGQSIVIGDNIVVQIQELKNGYVRLRIEAPKSVPVNREEVYDRIKKEKSEAGIFGRLLSAID